MTYLDKEEGMSREEKSPPTSESHFTSASADFTALCHAQMRQLSQSIAMDWAGVYLTQRNATGQTQLIPIVIYPQANREQSIYESWTPLLINQKKYLKSAQENFLSTLPQQIILPLLDDTDVLGLLVVVRNEQNWLEKEFNQIEASASVLALARKIELNCSKFKNEVIQLERQKEKQQQYLDDLLHQLRNPVTALRTFARLLMRKLLPQENYQQVIKGIFRESERLTELLQDSPSRTIDLSITPEHSSLFLLEESGKLTVETLSLLEILEPLVNSFRVIAREKDLDLQMDLPKNLPLIRANAKALTEVISNLIDNALKYTPALTGKVLITAETEAAWVKIYLSDNGYGIPPSEQAQIFERHYRGKQTESAIAGSGLGLAIVKDLLDQMNGRIEVVSPAKIAKENQGLPGSTFIVWLLSVAD